MNTPNTYGGVPEGHSLTHKLPQVKSAEVPLIVKQLGGPARAICATTLNRLSQLIPYDLDLRTE